jgi:hypothetical protein
VRRPILALTLLVACVAAVTTALTVVATDSLFGNDAGFQIPDHRSTVVPDPNQPSLPAFTIKDEERVKEIALSDPRVQAILEGHAYHVSQVGMWTGEHLELLGGVVEIVPDDPSTVSGEWYLWSAPNCETNPDEDPVLVSFRATYADLTAIHVQVNLQTGVAESIFPLEGELVGEEEFTGEYKEIKDCHTD